MSLVFVCFAVLIGSAVADVYNGKFTTTDQTIVNYGYPVETYFVKAEDGYILRMFRIPGSPKCNNTASGKPAVYIQHGLAGSTDNWFAMGYDSLPLLLADVCYDVWLGNTRGNTYSRNHTSLAIYPCSTYWKYTWHDMGYYDVAAMFDKILSVTGLSKVSYIAHSQGSTAALVLMSKRPEYQSKCTVAIYLGPVAFINKATSPVMKAVALASIPGNLLKTIFQIGCEFLAWNEWAAMAANIFCQDGMPTQGECSDLMSAVGGYNKEQENPAAYQFFYTHNPNGMSVNQAFHYGQCFNAETFQEWDFGLIGNLLQYSSPTPPKYPLYKISTPTTLFYGEGDTLADPTDVLRLKSALPNAEAIPIANSGWSHGNFLFGKDAKSLVYDLVLKKMNEANWK